MPDLKAGESVEVQGSAKKPYLIQNIGGVYSCTCPAWRNQSLGIEQRTCKHIRKIRGDEAEKERVGNTLSTKRTSQTRQDGPPLLLAHRWENDWDLRKWWMSEKLDGVRAYWDGKRFLSRQGNEFHAPDWFIQGMPETPLDGELWMDRKSFQKTVSIVRRRDRGVHWNRLRYVVFDAPAISAAFEERLQFVKECVADVGSQFVQALRHKRCRNLNHLRDELTRIEALGGEGLMLREPGSHYEVGRSMTLLKVKTFHDADAVVVDHVAGKGRHKGRMGALLLCMPDGTEFSVGTGFTDKQRERPPERGSIVTFRYQELSDAGVPRFPSYVRARQDTDAESAPSAANQKSAENSGSLAVTASTIDGNATVRYFELSDDKSSKFWEVSVDGVNVIVRYGRIGTTGQTRKKTFGDAAAAQSNADTLAEQKTRKGYTETERM